MREWYWIGIVRDKKRGSGVTRPIAFPSAGPPGAYPVPDEWLGFAMLADARRIAHMLAHAPIEQVTTYMTETFPSLLKRGEVAYWREKGE